MKRRRNQALALAFSLIFLIQMACIAVDWPVITEQDASPQGECIAPKDAIAWSYEDFAQKSDSGNVVCNARLVFRNTSAEPLYLFVDVAWDNHTSQYNGWELYPLAGGGTWEQKVNRSSFANGDLLYIKVVRFLVVPDTPECTSLISIESKSSWEPKALYIDEMPCP